MSVEILIGPVLERLRTLRAESVHCVVTSPPYFALHSYLPDDHPDKRHEIGLEKTPDAFIAALVEVFREVRRVLRSDGVCFVNLGDSYANDGKWGGATGGKHAAGLHGDSGIGREKKDTGLKPKDLIGIPWRVALALQADGWWLRQDIIWAKPNPMPESVTDRCTKAHEYIFLLTKSAHYFWDAAAIQENSLWPSGPNSPQSISSPYGQGFARRATAFDDRARPPGTRPQTGMTKNPRRAGNKSHKYVDQYASDGTEQHRTKAGLMAVADVEWTGRNKRSVWTMSTTPYPEAHFATFPPELPDICIKAGTSEYGCCAHCGAPFERVVEKALVPTAKAVKTAVVDARDNEADENDQGSNRQKDGHKPGYVNRTTTTGWQKTCTCMSGSDPVPCLVLDPFGGAGTTGMVADRLGRDAVLIELSSDFAAMAKRRIARDRLDRKSGTMDDVKEAKLEPTPLEALMMEAE